MTNTILTTASEPIVTITLKEYEAMASKNEHFENIVKNAFHGAKLNWSKDDISLNTNAVEQYIKALFTERCDMEVSYLQDLEERKNGKPDND